MGWLAGVMLVVLLAGVFVLMGCANNLYNIAAALDRIARTLEDIQNHMR